MKEIGFRIVLNSTALGAEVTKLQTILGKLNGTNGKFNISTASATNLGKMSTNLDVLLPKLDRYVKLMKSAAALNISGNFGGVGGGNNSNGGSRTGTGPVNGTRSILSGFSGFIRGGQSFTSGIGAAASGIGRLGAGVGLPLFIGAQAIRGIVEAVSVTRDFSDASAELASRLGESRSATFELDELAKKLGGTMALTATQVSEAQTALAKLGFSKDDILGISEGVSRLGIVLGSDLDRTAKATGATLKSFNLQTSDTDRVVSALGVSTAKSALDFASLEAGINQTFATANAFGLELEDTLALLGKLKDAGLSDSVAATASRNILLNLSNEKGDLRQALSGLGIKEVKGLDGILDALKRLDLAGISLNDTLELTDKRSVNAFNIFLRNTEGVDKLRKSITNVNGEFEIMEKERLNSLGGSLILFKSKLESVFLGGGLEDISRVVVDFGTNVLEVSRNVTEFAKNLVAAEGKSDFERTLLANNRAIGELLGLLATGNLSYQERAKIIDELNGKYGSYLDGLNLETATSGQLLGLKEKINIEAGKKIQEVTNQDLLNKSLAKEKELLEDIVNLKANRAKGIGFFDPIFSPVDTYNRLTGSKLTQDQKELDKLRDERLGLYNPKSITVAQYEDLASPAGKTLAEVRKYAVVVGKTDEIIRGLDLGKTIGGSKEKLIGFYDSQNKFIEGEISVEIKRLTKLQKSYDATSKVRSAIDKQIDLLQNREKELKAAGAKSFSTTKGSTGKEEESFAVGSVRYLEKILKEAEDAIVRFSGPNESLAKAADLALKNLTEAKRKLDLLRADTPKEIYDKQLSDLSDFQSKELLRLREGYSDKETLALREKALDLEIKKEKLAAQDRLNIAEGKTGSNGPEISLVQQQIDENAKLLAERLKFRDEDLDIAKEISALDIKNFEDRENAKSLILEKALLKRKERELLDEKDPAQRTVLGNDITGIKTNIDNLTSVAGNGQNLTDRYVRENEKLTAALKKGDDKALLEFDRFVTESKLLDDILIANSNKKAAEATGDEQKIAEAIRKELEARRALVNFTEGNKDEDSSRRLKKIQAIGDAAGQVALSLLDFESANADAKAEADLARIDVFYAAKLAAAKGNAAEEEKIQKEYDKARARAEAAAAKKRKEIAIKEAIIQTALNVIKSLDNLPAIPLILALGAIQVATIKKQSLAGGGFYKTGAGRSPDGSGEYVAGNATLHAGEFVVRRKTISRFPFLTNFLENDRLRYRGYDGGGSFGGSGTGFGETRLSSTDMEAMSGMVAAAVSRAVYESSLKGTTEGSRRGSSDGAKIAAAQRESRYESKLINTY